ncbi:hypothetical protein HNY73_020188 [Argiope bruennichi]|uniref:Uncharacterized protein n=1 Tax=Argiope bruennichi TaxID=94029 RepID=A0A8T0E8K0_ARGBR|nr:hypothetical protein HNY73_020188 [Argiope bruennichi]
MAATRLVARRDSPTTYRITINLDRQSDQQEGPLPLGIVGRLKASRRLLRKATLQACLELMHLNEWQQGEMGQSSKESRGAFQRQRLSNSLSPKPDEDTLNNLTQETLLIGQHVRQGIT